MPVAAAAIDTAQLGMFPRKPHSVPAPGGWGKPAVLHLGMGTPGPGKGWQGL